MSRYFLLKLESYDGKDTFLSCGNDSQTHLFAVACLSEGDDLRIVDNGYRTEGEAKAAWPEIGDLRRST